MAGGLMQLVAYGAQDVYLTGDPKITFFKKMYSRYTSFAMEAIKLTLQGTIGNGNTIQVIVGRDADLIQDMWVELTPLTSAPPAWVAERAFKTIELDIGGQRIDKHYKTWFRLYAEVFLPESKKLNYGKMTSLGNSTADTSAPNNVILPLLFFFNRDPGLALPLVALQYHEVRIVFELADDYLTYFSQNYFLFWGNYIYLDSLERKLFSTKEHDYLIDQVQHTGGDLIGSGILNPSFRLPFQHPVKELIWCFKNTTPTNPNNYFNFTTDTSNVNVTILQQSNVSAPHTYGSPVLTVPTNSTGPDAGVLLASSNAFSLFGNVVSLSSTGKIAVINSPFLNTGGGISATTSTSNVYRDSVGLWVGPTPLPAKRTIATGTTASYSTAISPEGIFAANGDASLAQGATTFCNVFYYNSQGVWQDYASYTQSSAAIGGFNSLALSSPTPAGYPILAAGCIGNAATGGSIGVGTSQTVVVSNIDTVKLTDNKNGTKLGISVAINYAGTLIAGGAPGAGAGLGNVAVYYNAGTWGSVINPTSNIAGTVANGAFGSSVSLNSSGTTLAVGAPGGAAGGQAFVYSSSGATIGSSWTLAGTFLAKGTSDLFGTAVSLNTAGTLLAVGAPGANYVSVYQQTNNVWSTTPTTYLGTTGSLFGKSISSAATGFIVGSPFTTTTTGNYVQAYSGPVPVTTYKTWVEDGGPTSALAVGPLSSLNLDLNGQSRFYPQTGKYFNQYQPYRYHMGSPYPGIYSYSFAVNPEMHQPSGSCNFSRIDNSQINIILKNSMYTPCYLSLFAVNYNLFRVKSGMGGLVFAN